VPKEHLARTDVNSSSPGTEPAGGARSARDGASGIGEWAVDASFLRACAARLVLFKKYRHHKVKRRKWYSKLTKKLERYHGHCTILQTFGRMYLYDVHCTFFKDVCQVRAFVSLSDFCNGNYLHAHDKMNGQSYIAAFKVANGGSRCGGFEIQLA